MSSYKIIGRVVGTEDTELPTGFKAFKAVDNPVWELQETIPFTITTTPQPLVWFPDLVPALCKSSRLMSMCISQYQH
jgi:hypothetical protein